MDRVAGIGGYVISNDKNDIIRTFAPASCVALTTYSPSKNAAGIVHIALPSPKGGSATQPGYFQLLQYRC